MNDELNEFINQSDAGNEKAIRQGRKLPDGAVNLAYFKTKPITPENNIIILDSSNTIQENQNSTLSSGGPRKLMYANTLGILEDDFGNQLLDESNPIVTDIFNVEEDWSILPGNEYTVDSMLPFLHVSRYFHVDFANQTPSGGIYQYIGHTIKVDHEDGTAYNDANGNPRYKICITQATIADVPENRESHPYRVLVYIDTDITDDLYVTYNKIEVDENLMMVNQQINHRERLNPIRVFKYQAEESIVTDPVNRREQWFATDPYGLKEETLGLSSSNVDGYKAYVPRKAIPDSRIFQLFRWRIKTTFRGLRQVDPSRNIGTVKCGMIVTDRYPTSRSPYTFYNLARSAYNADGLKFVNPLSEGTHYGRYAGREKPLTREEAEYWYVNIDHVTPSELAQFDMLIWSPAAIIVDYARYAERLSNYANLPNSGIILIDTNNYSLFINAPVTFGLPVNPIDRSFYQNIPDYAGVFGRKGKVNEARWHTIRAFPASVSIEAAPSSQWIPELSDLLHVGDPQAATPSDNVEGWDLSFPVLGDHGVPLGRKITSNDFKSWTVTKLLNPSLNPNNDARCQVMFDTTDFAAVRIISTVATQVVSYHGRTGPIDTPADLMVGSLRYDYGSNSRLEIPKVKIPMIWSTIGLPAVVGRLYDWQAGYGAHILKSANTGNTIANVIDYDSYINSSLVAGAYKYLYNMVLAALKGKIINTADATSVATEWEFYTPWQSSWTVNADNDILSDYEKTKYDFFYLPTDAATPAPVWQRRLSTKTIGTLIDEALSDEEKITVQGTSKTFQVEFTNDLIDTVSDLTEDQYLYAWTDAYTPPFIVPLDVGPHVVREEDDLAEYAFVQRVQRVYPPRPYSGRVRASFIGSFVGYTDHANWIATGTAKETITVTKHIPASTTTQLSNIKLTWNNAIAHTTNGADGNPYKGAPTPLNVRMGQLMHYYNYNSWAFYGIVGQWAVGASGEVVAFMQEALNRFQYWGIFRLPHGRALAVNGNYNASTEAAIRAFQISLGAKYIDGVVDAETLSLIGGQIYRLGNLSTINTNHSDYTRFFGEALGRMPMYNLADGSDLTTYGKRSWIRRGPRTISEDFFIRYDNVYKITGVSVEPFIEGAASSVNVHAVDVAYCNQIQDLSGWSSSRALIRNLPNRAHNGTELLIPLWSPVHGNTVIVTLVQDQASFSSSRMIGIKNIFAHAEVLTPLVHPAHDVVTQQVNTLHIKSTGTVYFRTDRLATAQATYRYTGPGHITDIQWNNSSLVIDNPAVRGTMSPSGHISFMSDALQDASDTGSNANFVFGPHFPPNTTDTGTYGRLYSMDVDGNVSHVPDNGYVSKSEGVKLLCKHDGTPWGFGNSDNALFPTHAGANAMRHFVKLSFDVPQLDPSVRVFFYDRQEQAIIAEASLEASELSVEEYFRRGPNNIYIGVTSTASVDSIAKLPNSDGGTIPRRWAMPVYGIEQRSRSRISIKPLPKHLGRDDFWPVPISVGSFSRIVQVGTTSWLPYAGQTIRAFYAIPESKHFGWSTVYGPPNVDIADETPLIVDNNWLQVRQTPILMEVEPTLHPNRMADPVRPVFVVSTRPNVHSPWVPLPWTEIHDYNVNTGEIFLKKNLQSTDDELVKVDYTVRLDYYPYKGSVSDPLNLNPFPGQSMHLIGKAIHIYILPEYIRDENNRTIAGSQRTRCVFHTLDDSIFDPMNDKYNPLAIRLGMVYIANGLDVEKDLQLLDTRVRGGGAISVLTDDDVVRLVGGLVSYWDVVPEIAGTYQSGGFIIIRLPEELSSYLTEADIRHTIERNITAGVQYELQTLTGESWS